MIPHGISVIKGRGRTAGYCCLLSHETRDAVIAAILWNIRGGGPAGAVKRCHSVNAHSCATAPVHTAADQSWRLPGSQQHSGWPLLPVNCHGFAGDQAVAIFCCGRSGSSLVRRLVTEALHGAGAP